MAEIDPNDYLWRYTGLRYNTERRMKNCADRILIMVFVYLMGAAITAGVSPDLMAMSNWVLAVVFPIIAAVSAFVGFIIVWTLYYLIIGLCNIGVWISGSDNYISVD